MPPHAPRVAAAAILSAAFIEPGTAANLATIREPGKMCVSLDGASRDDMVVLVKTSEKTAANLDADRPADALLAAIADGTMQAFGRGSLDGCIEVSKGDDFALAAFSVGDRVTFLGTTTAQPQRRIKSREVPRRARDGRMVMETIEYVADELLVTLPAGAMDLGAAQSCFTRDAVVADAQMTAVLSEVNASVIRKISPNHDGLLVLKGVACDPYEYCQTARLGRGITVEPNFIINLDAQPGYVGGQTPGDGGTMPAIASGVNEPRFDELWGLHNTGQEDLPGEHCPPTGSTAGTRDADIDAPGAWRTTTGDPSVVVAVIDTGVDYTHPELRRNMWVNPGEVPGNGIDDDGNGYIDDYHGYDFHGGGDPDPLDDHRHGTHVSGTIAAAVNGRGVVGVAPDVRIMAIKAFSAGGSGSISDAVESVMYAADNGAAITSNSYGTSFYSATLRAAFEYAADRDVVSIAAAGNDNNAEPNYPAAYDAVLAVAATDRFGDRACFSTYGSFVGVAAPGHEILSSVPAFHDPSGYAYSSGTSMACPHVAGVAALIRSVDPDASWRAVTAALKTAVDPIETDQYVGTGLINARLAVRRPHNPELTAHLDDIEGLVTGSASVRGTAAGAAFDHYVLEAGFGRAPASWTPFHVGSAPVTDGVLGVLDLNAVELNSGTFTLRLRVLDADDVDVLDTTELRTDNTNFTSPLAHDVLRAGALLEMQGSTGVDGFQSYQIEWRPWEYDGSFPIFLGPWSTDGVVLADGGTQAVYAGRLGDFDTSVVAASWCALKLTIVADSETVETVIDVYLDPTLRSGYPLRIAHDPNYGGELNVLDPVVQDLDGDGVHEIYALQNATLYGFDVDGTDRPGFPLLLPTAPDRVYTTSALTVADIDADGAGEILFASVRNQTISIGSIEHDGTTTPGFPIAFTYDGTQGPAVIRPGSSVVVDDLDADGVDEIVFQAFDLLVVTETDGTLMTGGLIHLRPGATDECGRPLFEDVTTRLDATPAVGDLDGDAELEIVVWHQMPDCGGGLDAGIVMAFDPDGLPLWERTTRYPAMGSSPVLGDLDGDGLNEVVVAAYQNTTAGGLHVFDGAGTLMPGWPRHEIGYGFPATPALGDLDGDGDLEIAVADNRYDIIHVYHHTGDESPIFHGVGAPYSSALLDVDQDGIVDLTSSTNEYPNSAAVGLPQGAFARDALGAILPGFPKAVESNAWTPIQVMDLDGDGTVEAISSSFKDIGDGFFSGGDAKHRGSIYVWELPWSVNPDAPIEWPTFHGNYRRTGRYGDH